MREAKVFFIHSPSARDYFYEFQARFAKQPLSFRGNDISLPRMVAINSKRFRKVLDMVLA